MKARVSPLSSNQRRVIRSEINRQCVEFEKEHEAEQVCRSLWVLHKYFGFGAKRLTEFYRLYMSEVNDLVEHYEMSPNDALWLCMKKLHDAGFDFAEDDNDFETA